MTSYDVLGAANGLTIYGIFSLSHSYDHQKEMKLNCKLAVERVVYPVTCAMTG